MIFGYCIGRTYAATVLGSLVAYPEYNILYWNMFIDVLVQMLAGGGARTDASAGAGTGASAGEARRHRQIKEKRMLNRDEVYDGALEDILCGNEFAVRCHLCIGADALTARQ